MSDQGSTDLRQARRRKPEAKFVDRLPPHSIPAEQGVLGTCIVSSNGAIDLTEAKLGRAGEGFYDQRHQSLFKSLVEMRDKHLPIDPITLYQFLQDHKTLEGMGGLAYVNHLPDCVGDNLDAYLKIVSDKWALRKVIINCTEIVGRAYDFEGDVSTLIGDATQDFSHIAVTHESKTQEHWPMRRLVQFDCANDPHAIIGLHNGLRTRYLCMGYGAWQIGSSGVGKSTYNFQQAIHFALGKPFFGMHPIKPRRVLIVQNENDEGDCAETAQGILDAANITPEEFDALNERLKIIRCRGLTGQRFTRWLEREVIAWRADIVYVDPLLRFAGIDVSRQDQCTHFLNDLLDPVLANTGVVLIGVHHTGKPKNQKETQNWTIYDYMYAGIGSSELVNWARAVSIIRVLPAGMFELLLAKRGSRAWATHPNGEFTTSVFLRHAKDKIYWEQVDPPELASEKSGDRSQKGGRPSVVDQVAASNLFEFVSKCLPEGEGLNQIAKRLESYLATKKMDVSLRTAQRIIPALVANEKLLKNQESLYLKGPQA